MSACQRSGSVNVDTGIGSTTTCAPAGSLSAANAAVHPVGTAGSDPAGSGRGTSGAMAASTASAIADRAMVDRAMSHRALPHRGAGSRACAQRARAASRPNVNSAAAAPSARIENRSGITELATGRACSQYQGSVIQACSCPPASSVPPSESTSSTTSTAAVTRTVGSRQNSTAAAASAMSIGQPR